MTTLFAMTLSTCKYCKELITHHENGSNGGAAEEVQGIFGGIAA
jgi:hypothetical protein